MCAISRQHVGSDTLGDRAHTRKIDGSGVGAGSHRDHFGTVLLSKCFELICSQSIRPHGAHRNEPHQKIYQRNCLVPVRQVSTMA